MNNPDLSLVVACYNEGTHLLYSIREIEEVMGQTKYSYEFIFIDDQSKDDTRELIKKICQTRSNCRFLFHEKNVGRGGTVREGLLAAHANYAGFLDIDLEVPARYIPNMVLWLERGYDMVSVERIERFSFNPYKLLRFIFSEGCKKVVASFLGTSFPDSAAGFKFFNMSTMREVVDHTKDVGWFWDTEVVLKSEMAHKKLKSVRGVFEHRLDKKSTVRLIPDTIAYLRAIRNFKKNEQKSNL